MKRLRKILVLSLAVLTFSVQCLFAVNYHASLTLAASPALSAVKNDPLPTRSRLLVEADIGALSLRITPRQVLSIPVEVSWYTDTVSNPGIILKNNLNILGGVGYQYDMSDLFSMRGSIQAGVRLFLDCNGWTPVYGSATFEFLICPFRGFAITFPVKASFVTKECDLSVGVGLSCFFDFGLKEPPADEEAWLS